jgi:MFS family permease
VLYVTAFMLELGVSTRNVGWTWVAGSILVILVNPYIGTWSDHWYVADYKPSGYPLKEHNGLYILVRSPHPWGRRRIFILWTAGLGFVGFLMFANAEQLGYLMGDSSSDHTAAIVLAIIGLMAGDVSDVPEAGGVLPSGPKTLKP